MQMNKKIFNNRLSNDYDNLGSLVTGMQKDLNEISGMILGFEKYGTQVHNLRKDVQNQQRQFVAMTKTAGPDASIKANKTEQVEVSEGILGRIPENVESIAELMLQDSDVNVYQESKVTLKEEAFTIRGRKQKTQSQRQ